MFEMEKLKEMDLELLYKIKNIKEEYLDSMKGFLYDAIDTEKYYQDEITYHKRRYVFETETDKENLERLERNLSKARKNVANLQNTISEGVSELEKINNAIKNIENKEDDGMILYNCTSERELELKDIDVKKLTVEELRLLAISVIKDYQTNKLQNQIIMGDAIIQITGELANRCK